MNVKTYPVNLLLEKRACLIVGGGKVAARKVKGLLETGCGVTVVAPKIREDISEMAREGQVEIIQRDFRESDLEGIALVFATTDDRAFNENLLEMARTRGVMCCAVDENWRGGDFIRPASFEKNGVQVAISTHGRACRRTKMIKDNLSRHVEMVDKAELLVMGTDHNYLNLTQREPFHLIGARFDEVGALVNHVWGVHEFLLFNTCNRVELAAIVSPEASMEELLRLIMGFDKLGNDGFYAKYGWEAFQHMAGVASGLMSQTPGEKHIVAQLKAAYDESTAKGWAGAMMRRWMDCCLHVSKDIRHEVEPYLKNFEIEDLTVKYLLTELPDLAKKNLLILGTGMVGECLAENLSGKTRQMVWCYHKNQPKRTPEGCRIIGIKELKENLSEVDVMICATSASYPIVHHGHSPFFDSEKSIRVIDLASPRNVSPELEKLMPNIQVVDLDDLKFWYRREAVDMASIFEISHKILREHVDYYEGIIDSFQAENKSSRP